MIIVNTNLLAYVYLPTEFSAQAEALLERDADWAAPRLWRSEFRNLLKAFPKQAVALAAG